MLLVAFCFEDSILGEVFFEHVVSLSTRGMTFECLHPITHMVPSGEMLFWADKYHRLRIK